MTTPSRARPRTRSQAAWVLLAASAFATRCARPDRTPARTVHDAERSATAPPPRAPAPPVTQETPPVGERLALSEAEWRARLTPEQYHVLREEGTEPAFTGAYWNHHAEGTYACAACGAPLFSSRAKFDSGTGWPSYYEPIERGRVEERRDDSHGMVRTEVHCARCGGHLGHVFDDGPRPTGLRYCIDSISLAFRAAPAR